MSKRRCPACNRPLKTAKQREADRVRQKRFYDKHKAVGKLPIDGKV